MRGYVSGYFYLGLFWGNGVILESIAKYGNSVQRSLNALPNFTGTRKEVYAHRRCGLFLKNILQKRNRPIFLSIGNWPGESNMKRTHKYLYGSLSEVRYRHCMEVANLSMDSVALQAIELHTLRAIDMTIPHMIIFVADFASKDRRYKSAKEVRELGFKNLKAAFRLALAKKIGWNLKASKPLHPFTIQVWNSLQS